MTLFLKNNMVILKIYLILSIVFIQTQLNMILQFNTFNNARNCYSSPLNSH